MQIRLGLFVISALLFICGIGFVVAGARAQRRPVAAPAETMATVASVKQIMRGIVDPAATTVFGAVSTTMTAAGLEEKAPSTQAEWDVVADSAAALAEAGNLLLVGDRVVDRADWTTFSRKMTEAGRTALAAAEARDAEGVFASGEAIYDSCNGCHSKYQRTQ
ncbi:MAG TPA: hypothetical protein VM032_04900 [Vicinamibacterales bacterium]|nr:hypothetical protein [Vicinamibacterales bacterium]